MNKLISIIACCFALAWVSRSTGQTPTPSGSVTKDVEKTARDAKVTVIEKKEEYEMRIRAELEDLKAKIAEQDRKMRASIDSGKTKVTEAFRERTEALKRQEKAVEADLRRVKASGETELKRIKADIDKNMVKIKKGYNDLLENLKAK